MGSEDQQTIRQLEARFKQPGLSDEERAAIRAEIGQLATSIVIGKLLSSAPSLHEQALRKALTEVSPKHREVFGDVIKGMSVADAAKAHNVSAAAVMNTTTQTQARYLAATKALQGTLSPAVPDR